MEFGIDVMKENKWLLFGIIALFLISMNLSGLALEEHVSPKYIDFYQNLAYIAMSGSVILVVFMLSRENHIGEILGIDRKTKVVIFVAFIIFIVFMTTGLGQILPVPKASIGFQLNADTELYTSTVIPGFVEDYAFLIVLPMVLLTIFLYVTEKVFGIEPGRGLAILFIILSCLISSTGFNIWVIPGFTSAHVPAYGEVQGAYIGAWIFGFGQSMVYMFTGYFVPIAHMAHNFLISYGNLYGISIGQFQIT